MLEYDIVIVGGGLVGAGLSLALRHLPLRIALIDARLPTAEDKRLFALNIHTCHFLQHLKLWSYLKAYANPIHEVQVSTQGRFGSLRLNKEELQLPALGYVIPSQYLEEAFYTALNAQTEINTYRPFTLLDLQQQAENIVLNIKNNSDQNILQLNAKLVIGADGTYSTVRKALHIGVEEFDYQQQAIVTTTTVSKTHQQKAYERFHSYGTIALLPLLTDTCATICTVDNAIATEWLKLSDADFLRILQNAFGYRLGKLRAIGERYTYTVKQVKARKMVDGKIMLLGNAAHTVHPVAAQGLNLAIYEVAVLTEAIEEHFKQQLPLSTLNLEKIAEKIQKQQQFALNISHHVSRSQRLPLIGHFLQLGLVACNIVNPLKKQFLRNMLGQTGTVPRLLLRAIE